MYLALNEMKKNKKKFSLILLIIVLISYLVFFLSGLADGLSNDKVSAINLWKGKEVVLNKDSNKNITRSFVNYKDMSEFKESDPSAISIVRQSAFINDLQGEDDLVNIVVMGVEKNSHVDPTIIEGNVPTNEYETVVSKDLVDEYNVKINDVLHLTKFDHSLKVVGISEASKYGNTPVVYTNLKFTNDLYEQMLHGKHVENKEDYVVNAFVLNKDNTNTITNKDLEVVGMKDFIKKLPGYYAEQLTFLLMIGFLIVISAIVLGVFLFIITLQKKMTFGIMKIQGISSSYIAKSVFAQTLLMALSGVLIGLLLTVLTGVSLPASVPFKINAMYFAIMSILLVGTSLLGALFSMHSVSKIDPLEALE